MSTESQTSYNAYYGNQFSSGGIVGQKLPSSSRLISVLSFFLRRTGSPGGTVTFTIRAADGYPGTLLGSKLLGNANDISTSVTQYSVTFDASVPVNSAFRILVEITASNGSNYIAIAIQNSDIKAGENTTASNVTAWDESGYDTAYSYTYFGGLAAPSVTIQAVSSITATTATGNGNVTALGEPAATQHGHVWATHPLPSISNSTTTDPRTTKGVPAATGAYTSDLTELKQNTLYYIRSYITNSIGTFYSGQALFITSASTPVVTTNKPTSVMVTTAVGQGAIDNFGGSAVTAFGVCWSTSAISDTGLPPTIDHTEEVAAGATVALGDFYSAITGLLAATLYHIRFYATNGVGTAYGADLTFTTLPVGVPIVTLEKTTDVQPISATGNGTIVDLGNSAVTQYGHCWKVYVDKTTTPPTTSDSKTELYTSGVVATGAFISQITGLTAGTAYIIRAYATNTQGVGYSSNELINEQTGGQTRLFGVLGEHLVYISASNKQRAILGVEF